MEVQSEKHWRLNERLHTLKLFQRRSHVSSLLERLRRGTQELGV